MKKYQVIYFDGRGRAEILRMTLRAADVDFEDIRVSKEEWVKMKPNTPSGYLPILVTPEGKEMVQSIASARYLAHLFGFMGKSTWDQYCVDRAIDHGLDFIEGMAKPLLCPPESREAALTEFMNTNGRHQLRVLHRFIVESGGEFIAGNYLTLADIWWNAILYVMKTEFIQAMQEFPKILSYYDRVLHSNPGLLRWERERPKTPW